MLAPSPPPHRSPGGQNNDFAAILHRDQDSTEHPRTLFCKGVKGVSLRMRWLRNEITAGKLAAGIAPDVVFAADVGDWLVVGFEHVCGRPADLTPGSVDLPLVATTVDKIAALPATGLRPLRNRWSGGNWWAKTAAEYPDQGSISRP
ncbi:hypothetical protein GCM10011581_22180 [Saccharopolyspora subtropica]|uniref:Aminoglycoside phosphotransferase domain-containing protein n=1 Tax=Saccharopolyspora thermophila TaxID=89367 RepID=A0A917JUC4_9PSEU|nr:hypothetical protein [Saccharopolyspora subtropica]GGI84623.1 hypothetical protein GCM10011581_22180 [Saccharopolyspora subtropica]